MLSSGCIVCRVVVAVEEAVELSYFTSRQLFASTIGRSPIQYS